MAKLIFYPDKCKGCFLCLSACPAKIIEPAGKRNAQGLIYVQQKENTQCRGCGFCFLVCPDCAIEVINEGTK